MERNTRLVGERDPRGDVLEGFLQGTEGTQKSIKDEDRPGVCLRLEPGGGGGLCRATAQHISLQQTKE